jgi:hypothetical protein
MEVHPPHEPVHSWRDALIHIGLMTVGLFIALMLEGLVEYAHHKHVVHQARENIRRELEDNHKNAQLDLGYLKKSGDRLKDGIKTLNYIQAHRGAKNQSLGFDVEFTDLNDSAWRTARDTGALGYMPLDEVQSYASIYGLQSTLSEGILHLLTKQAEALAPIFATDVDFEKMPDSEFDDVRKAAATNYADVYVLQQMLQELDQQYEKALNKK